MIMFFAGLFGFLGCISCVIFFISLLVNFLTLIIIHQLSLPVLIYSFLFTSIFLILFHYFLYLDRRKQYIESLKLSAKQIIKFSNIVNSPWHFTYIEEESYLEVKYRNRKIMPKTFFDYIIIIFFHLYKIFQQKEQEKKQEKEQQKLINLEEARFTAKLIEEDIKKELKKSNEDLNKALKENEIILNRLAEERR